MDRDSVTFALIGVILLTAFLIAVYVVVPRLVRRGSGRMAAASAGASLGGIDGSRLARAVGPGMPIDGVGRRYVPRDDAPPTGDDRAAPADAGTGLLGASAWGRVVADEDARIRRYRRPATVVMIELDGLDRLVDRLGEEAADRLIPAVSDTVRRMAREADHVAHLGRGRFGVLLPETDEIQAINYVERLRHACDLWLEAGAISLRLAIGWASASGEDSLHDAARRATERMFAEIHRNARRSGDLVSPERAGGRAVDDASSSG